MTRFVATVGLVVVGLAMILGAGCDDGRCGTVDGSAPRADGGGVDPVGFIGVYSGTVVQVENGRRRTDPVTFEVLRGTTSDLDVELDGCVHHAVITSPTTFDLPETRCPVSGTSAAYVLAGDAELNPAGQLVIHLSGIFDDVVDADEQFTYAGSR